MPNTPTIQIDQISEAIVNVPGVTLNVLSQQLASQTLYNLGTYADIDALLETTFSVPVTGTYDIFLTSPVIGSSGGVDVQLQMLFDESNYNGFTEQAIEGHFHTVSGTNERSLTTLYMGQVTLEAGEHKQKPQWKKVSGASQLKVDAFSYFNAWLVLSTGSGAGGTIRKENALDQEWASTSDTFEAVQKVAGDYEIDVTTTEGEDLLIFVMMNCRNDVSGSDGRFAVGIGVDGATPAYTQFVRFGLDNNTGSDNNHWAQMVPILLRNQTGGKHTYQLMVRREVSLSGSPECRFTSVYLWPFQFRGGQVPIEKDGITVSGTPRAINIVGGTVNVSESDGAVDIELPQSVTADGSVIEGVPTAQQGSTAIDSGASYNQFWPDTTGSVDIVIPADGDYLLKFTHLFWGRAGEGTGQLRIVIDEGESNEQAVGGDGVLEWQARVHANALIDVNRTEKVTLTAGTHTFKGYFKIIEQSGLSVIGTGTRTSPIGKISLNRITGSGAGGTIVTEAALTSDVTISADDTITQLNDLSLTFDANVNEWVQFIYQILTSKLSATTLTRSTYYRIDGGAWTVLEGENGAYAVGQTGSFTLKMTTAGEHTIDFAVSVDVSQPVTIHGGTLTYQWFGLDNDLISRTWAIQYRGGLIPIRKDGVTILDKPQALDFEGVESITNSGGVAKIKLPNVVTADGSAIEVTDVSGNTVIDSATDTEILSDTITPNVAGLHRIMFSFTFYVSSHTDNTNFQFKLVFDEGGADELTVTSAKWVWRENTNQQHYKQVFYTGTAPLVAKYQTVKLYGSRTSGNTEITIAGAQLRQLHIQAITGSGAGGEILDKRTADQHWQSTGISNSWVAVQDSQGDMTITADFSEGEKPTLELRAFYYGLTASTDAIFMFGIGIDGAEPDYANDAIFRFRVKTNSGLDFDDIAENFIVHWPTALTEGEHTFKLWAQRRTAITGTPEFQLSSGSDLKLIRKRGGLVPIKSDGSLKLDTPGALNFINGEITVSGNQANITLPSSVAGKGDRFEVRCIATSNHQTTSASFEDIDAEFEKTFTTLADGTYDLSFTVCLEFNGSAQIGAALLQLVFDEGESNEQTVLVQSGNLWEVSGVASTSNIERSYRTLLASVDLTAGEHTVKPQWRRTFGTATVIVPTGQAFHLVGRNIIGSTVAGSVHQHSSERSNPYVLPHISTPLELSHTVKTVKDERVLFNITGWMQSVATYGGEGGYAYVLVDDVAIRKVQINTDEVANDGRRNISLSDFTDPLSAGDHVIKVQFGGSAASQTELWDAHFTTTILRGGLVPIKNSDNQIVQDKPTEIKFENASVTETDGAVTVALPEALTKNGSLIHVTDSVSTSTITDTATQFFPDSGTVSFDVSEAGLYQLTFTAPFSSTTASSLKTKLVFDEGESNEQTVGDTEDWYARTSGGAWVYPTFKASVTLTAGTHTVKAYGTRLAGTDTITAGSGSPQQNPTLQLTFLSGSGAGGVLVDRTVLQSDQLINTTHPSWEEVTECNTVIDALGGEQLLLTFAGYGDPTTGGITSGHFEFRVDGVSSGYIQLNNADGYNFPVNLSAFTPVLTAGSHTITVYAAFSIGQWNLKAGAVFSVARFRGGLVPIQKDSTTVVDTPAGINFVGPNTLVNNNGGYANVEFNGIAEGVEELTDTQSSSYTESEALGGTWYNILKDGVSTNIEIDFECEEDEVVEFRQFGQVRPITSDGTVSTYANCAFFVDGVNKGQTTLMNGKNTVDSVIPFWHSRFVKLSKGSHTVDLRYNKFGTTLTIRFVGQTLQVKRYKGGYVQPDNEPILDNFSGDTVDLVAAPGADNGSWLKLNNGQRYYATLPVSVDLTTTGEGGREASKSAPTGIQDWYLYAVPSSTAGQWMVIGTTKDPSSGPDDYSIWKYLYPLKRYDGTNNQVTGLIPIRIGSDNVIRLERYISSTEVNAFAQPQTKTSLSLPEIPTTAETLFGYCLIKSTGGNVGDTANIQFFVVGETTEIDRSQLEHQVGSADMQAWKRVELPLNAGASRIDASTSQVGSSTISGQELWITGYTDKYKRGGLAVQTQAKYSPNPVTASSSGPVALNVSDSGNLYTNEGATAEVEFNLPSAQVGLEFSFIVQDTDGIQVNANTGDTIRIGASVSAAAGLIETTTIGNAVKLKAINNTEWVAMSNVGTWTVT